MEANSSRRQKRLRIPVRSHIQKRPRLASTQSETSTSEWIVEEVSHASSSIPAPEPSSVQPSGLTADDVLKLLTTIQNDFGSECSLMRDSDAQKLNLSKDFSNLPVLKGFGNSVVVPHYKSNIFVKIDEVESQIEILVVKDEFLQCPLLIGQDFTEKPCVSVMKNSDTLLFYKSAVKNYSEQDDSIKLMVSTPVELNQIGLVEVCASNESLNEDVFVEGYNCGEIGREYHLHQGVYRLTKGKCHLVISNFAEHPIFIDSRSVLARARFIAIKEIRHVNRLIKDISSVQPLQKSEIKVGNQISGESLNRLYNLLQSYRDCFALDIGEIGCAKNVKMSIELTDDRPHNVGQEEYNWDNSLGKIQWGINNTVNATTQKTASEALFGMKLRDVLSNKLDIGTDRAPTSVQNIRDEIDSNIKITQKKQKARYDVGRAPAVVFSEGDLVKISRTNYYNKGNSSKLLSKFIGPFRIIKVLGNDRYQIANIPGFGKNKRKFESVVASDRIRPWVNINVPNSDKTSDSSSSADSEDDLPLSKHN
ncbi:hypothetical protein ACJJTC_016698 [Scirpophaga incertulas]